MKYVRRSGVFIVKLEQIPHLILVLLFFFNFEYVVAGWGIISVFLMNVTSSLTYNWKKYQSAGVL